MTLRNKTLLIFSGVVLCMMFFVYLIPKNIMFKIVNDAEKQSCIKNVNIAADYLSSEIDNLDSVTRDWAIWDDTYSFVKGKNKKYISANINDETFKTLNINFIAVVSSSKEVVLEEAYDLIRYKQVPVSKNLKKVYSKGSPILGYENGVCGFVSLDENPAIISVRPIVKSDGSGPSTGFIIMARYLNSRQIKKMSKIMHVNMDIRNFDDSDDNVYLKVKSSLATDGKVLTIPIDNRIYGFKILRDVLGKSTIVLSINTYRDIYEREKQSMNNFIIACLLIGILFELLSLFIIEKIVIRRLLLLNRSVIDISNGNTFAKRVKEYGNDEISSLSKSVNKMLDALEGHVYEITERTEQLEEAHSYQEMIFNTVEAGICVAGIDGYIQKYNASMLKMYGYTDNEILKIHLRNLMPQTHIDMYDKYKRRMRGDSSMFIETYCCRKDGTTFPAEIRISLLRNKNGKEIASVIAINDITERKNTELALRRKTEEQSLLLDNIDIQIWYLSDPETYGAVNNAHARVFGMDKNSIENKKIRDIVQDVKAAERYINFNKNIFNNKNGLKMETEYLNSNNEAKIYDITTSPMIDNEGNIEFVVCSAEDVTERKKSDEKIKYLSYHDKLTGLYNRAFFEDELRKIVLEGIRPFSVIIGDINGLKLANDVFGHNEGDKLLIKIAAILKDCCRPGDTIARWGGDEFSIILPYTTEKEALNICKNIAKACKRSSDGLIQASIALGTSTKEDDSKDIQEMIKEAEDWMYRHKLLENKSSRSSYVSLLEKTLFERNYETEEHAQRMRKLAVKVGKSIGLPNYKIDELNLLAALHDIGKIAIPDNILLKPGPLTDEEWKVMKKHPEIGYRIAVLSPELAPIAEAILTHHERWDGKGYPHGLKGEEIQVISRIISIVDTFDVMTHKRQYKGEVSIDEAIKEIVRCSGTQFDPELVKVFVKLIEDIRGSL